MSLAVTGLGAAIMFQIMWQVANIAGFQLAEDFALGIALVLTATVPITVFMMIMLWPNVDFRLAALLGIPSALASLVGVEVLVTFDQTWLRRGLGVVLFCTYATLILRIRLAKPENLHKGKTVDDLLTPSGIVQTFFVSVIAGLGRGLFAIGGPPVMLWATLNGVSRDVCRANVCACSVLQLPVTLVYLLVVKKVWRDEDLPYYLIFSTGGLIGLGLGYLIAKRVSEKRFKVILTCLILLAGAQFLSVGINPITIQALSVLGFSSLGMVFGTLVLRRKELPPEPDQADVLEAYPAGGGEESS